ncbi:MAG: CoA pyrophosphatase [Anaerolineales bacterium]|nr:CoA pyrophosphatase [Anaerolineales bacterium]
MQVDWLGWLKAALLPTGGASPKVGRRAAAVLLPLYQENDAWWLLFTRRTDSVEHHRGQVSFPGGMAEAADPHLAATALREAEEEIGLRPDQVELLGEMPPILTATGFWVTPIVGRVRWPTPLKLNECEVARLFGIPLAWLAEHENHTRRTLSLPGSSQPVEVITFQPYAGEVVWGATARIVIDFLRLLEPSAK